MEQITNHFLRPPYTRPEILSDWIRIRKNPGTFVQIPKKVVGHFFERGLVFERGLGFEKGSWLIKGSWLTSGDLKKNTYLIGGFYHQGLG